MHKLEAICLIKKELAKGDDLPEALILAILSLVQEASEFIRNESASVQSEEEVSPFKPPSLLMQW